MTVLDFDRSSRHVLVSRAIRAIAEPPGPVLDVGGSGGILGELLPKYEVIQLDVAGDDCDVIGSGMALPIRDGSVAIAVALDVLEHVPATWRQTLLEEMARVAVAGIVLAGPFDDPAVRMAEDDVDRIYRELTGRPHRWLSEHRDFGLPDLDGVASGLGDLGFTTSHATSNPLELWSRLQQTDFIAAESHQREVMEDVHQRLLDHYLDGADAETPAYRHIVIGTREPGLAKPAATATRIPGRAGGWTTQDALRALDLAVAAGLHAAARERQRLEREKDQRSRRTDALSDELRSKNVELNSKNDELNSKNDELRSMDDEFRREIAGLQTARNQLQADIERLSAEHAAEVQRLGAEYGTAVRTADDVRGQLEVKWREKVQLEDTLRATRDDLAVRTTALEQAARLIADARRDVDKIGASRRWRLGGMVLRPLRLLSRRRGSEDAVSRLQRRLASGPPVPRAPSAPAAPSRQTTTGPSTAAASATLAQTAESIARDVEALSASRRWRIGRKLTAPAGWVRRGGEPADRRLLARNRDLESLVAAVRSGSPDGPERLKEWSAAQADDAERLVHSRAWKTGSAVAAISIRAGEPAIDRIRRNAALVRGWTPPAPTSPSHPAPAPAPPLQPSGEPTEAGNDLYRTYIEQVEPSVKAGHPPEAKPVSVIVRAPDESIRSRIRATDTARRHRAIGFDEVALSGPSTGDVLEVAGAAISDYVVIIEPGDEVDPVLPHVLSAHDPADVVVTDHDLVVNGRRTEPVFLGGVSPDLLLERDVVRTAVALRRTELLEMNDLSPTDLHRDAILRIHDAGGQVAKADVVAFHLHPTEASPRELLDRDETFARHTIARRGEAAAVVERLHHLVRVRHTADPARRVSVIIPFRDKPDLLQVVVRSILRLTSHQNYEVLLVDNLSRERATTELLEDLTRDSRVTVVPFPEGFNYSRANNIAVQAATGDVLVFLNNDTRVLTPDWLDRLAGQALRPEVGAVGAKLLFANGSLQHAGVVVGMTGFAAHLFSGQHATDVPDDWIRHTRNTSAVTAACLAVERDKFDEVGGFDESFILTGNDVDLCLRLRSAGYSNVFDPAVELFHYEKQTRAPVKVPKNDQLLSLQRYEPLLTDGDPFYNSNLSLRGTRLEPRTEPNPGRKELEARVFAEEDRLPRPGLAYLELYDASAADIEANARLMNEFETLNRIGPLDTVSWFIPHFDHAYRGGIYTILRFAQALTDASGTLNRFVLCGKNSGDAAGIERRVREAFPDLNAEFMLLRQDGDPGTLPPSDVAVCTLWTTAYEMLRYNNCRGKFYFVQDYEPVFQPGNEIYGLIEQTYRFGYVGICNTEGVRAAYAAYGSPAIAFTPGVDASYTPLDSPADDGPLQIVFYGRPTNPRNGFELGIQALREIKHRHGDDVHVISAGAEWDPRAYDVDGVIENAGTLPDIVSVADLYRHSAIGLVFMFSKHPSYQPLEYMASGCVTVTNYNEANLWLLEDGVNSVLVPPTVSATADALSRLIEEPDLRAKIREAGLATVKDLTWGPQLEAMHDFMKRGVWR